MSYSSPGALGIVNTPMKKDNKSIPSGPFKGKRIELAPTTGIEMFLDIAEDFMRRIFDFEPGEYLITDESSLFDFTGVHEMSLSDIQKKIQAVYNLDVSDVESGNLLTIFMRMHRL
jgi:hypothetical protein